MKNADVISGIRVLSVLKHHRGLLWLLGALLAVAALLAGVTLNGWRKEREALADAAARCPQDIVVDLGGEKFRLPIVNGLTITLADESITPESARSLTPSRIKFTDNREYAMVCQLALTGKPVGIRRLHFEFWGEDGSMQRISATKRIVNFCKAPAEFGNARLCREEYIQGDIEPSFVSLDEVSPAMRGNGFFSDNIRNALASYKPEDIVSKTGRMGRLTWIECCGPAGTRYYLLPPASLSDFNQHSTITDCARIGEQYSCQVHGTYLGIRLQYNFSDAGRPIARLEDIDRSVTIFLNRLRVQQ